MAQRIEKYLNLDLFNSVSEFRIAYVPNQDINSSNVQNITDYESSIETELISDELATSRVYNPSKIRYNVIWGLTNGGQLVFLSPIRIDLNYLEVHRIELRVKLVESDLFVEFSIPDNLTYSIHDHTLHTKVDSINKFTLFSTELTDDNINFSKGKILTNSTEVHFLDNQVRIGSEFTEISGLSHLYGVDFRFEVTPSKVINSISDSNFDVTNPLCSLTYRGSTICYRDKLGKYHVINGSTHVIRSYPFSLINENLAVDYLGKVNILTKNDLIEQNYKLDVVIYRSGYVIQNNKLIKVI